MPTQVIWSTSLSKGATLCLYHVLKDLKYFLAIFFWHTLSRPERFHILVLTKLKGLSADSQYDSEVRSCKFDLLLLLFLLGCSSWKILGKFIFFFLTHAMCLLIAQSLYEGTSIELCHSLFVFMEWLFFLRVFQAVFTLNGK